MLVAGEDDEEEAMGWDDNDDYFVIATAKTKRRTKRPLCYQAGTGRLL